MPYVKLDPHNADQARATLRNLSAGDFLFFGMNQIAYIKPGFGDDGPEYTLHAADGSALLANDSLETVVSIARQKELFAVTLH